MPWILNSIDAWSRCAAAASGRLLGNNEPDKTFDRAIEPAVLPATSTVQEGSREISHLQLYDLRCGQRVDTAVFAGANPATGQYFSRWTGDKEILSNWLASTTSAMMPSMEVEVVATDSASTSQRASTGITPPAYGLPSADRSPPAGQPSSCALDEDLAPSSWLRASYGEHDGRY